MTITEPLIKELWKQNNSGGWSITQRTWEYFIAIKMSEFTKESILVDIGGGCPTNGTTFFADIVSKYIKCIVIDNCITKPPINNIIQIKKNVSYDLLKEVFNKYSPTHITCISVLEHIEDFYRKEIFHSINEHFKGESLCFTMEYHSKKEFFKNQLTTKSLSELFNIFTNFYLKDIQKTPIHAEAAFGDNDIPLWFPVAVKFEKLERR